MPIEITTEKRRHYLLMKSVGDIQDLDEWKEVSMKYFEIIAAHNSQNTISDIRELTFPQGIFSIMELVDHISEEQPISARAWRVAVVMSPADQEIGKFWETASANRGFTNSKAFFNFDEAEAWLISKIPK